MKNKLKFYGYDSSSVKTLDLATAMYKKRLADASIEVALKRKRTVVTGGDVLDAIEVLKTRYK